MLTLQIHCVAVGLTVADLEAEKGTFPVLEAA